MTIESQAGRANGVHDIRSALRRGPHDYLDVGHSRIAHWRFGKGPDLVLVHGWPLHSATFRDLVPHLAESHTCHLIDLPAVGRTESRPDAPVGLAEHAETLRRVVDILGLSRFAYVAHDSGAVISRIAAADDPRVAGLVLGNSEIPGHWPWIVVAYKYFGKIPGAFTLLRALMRVPAVRHSSLAFGSAFGDRRAIRGEFGEWFVEPLLASSAIMHGQMLLATRVDLHLVDRLAEIHGRIRAPALLIWGEDDRTFPVHKARAMLPQFGGGAELRSIANARTYPHEEYPQTFVEVAKPFLARCFSNASES